MKSLGKTSVLVRNLLEGDRLVLICTAAGLGIHLWYKDNKPIVSNSTNNFLLEAGPLLYSHEDKNYLTAMKLTVQSSKTFHTGSYKCTFDDNLVQKVTVYSSKV